MINFIKHTKASYYLQWCDHGGRNIQKYHTTCSDVIVEVETYKASYYLQWCDRGGRNIQSIILPAVMWSWRSKHTKHHTTCSDVIVEVETYKASYYLQWCDRGGWNITCSDVIVEVETYKSIILPAVMWSWRSKHTKASYYLQWCDRGGRNIQSIILPAVMWSWRSKHTKASYYLQWCDRGGWNITCSDVIVEVETFHSVCTLSIHRLSLKRNEINYSADCSLRVSFWRVMFLTSTMFFCLFIFVVFIKFTLLHY